MNSADDRSQRPAWMACVRGIWTRVPGFGSVLGAATLVPPEAAAHAGEAQAVHDLWSAWAFDPLLVFLLGLASVLYARGIHRLWSRAGVGRGIRTWRVWAFACGMVLLTLAILGPLDVLGDVLFSVHMTQHMALMSVVAPLLVVGPPVVAFLAGLPRGWGNALSRWWNRRSWTRVFWDRVASPGTASIIQGLALFAWHLPKVLELALVVDPVHDAMHISYLVAGLLFWWSLVRCYHQDVGPAFAGIGIVSTMMYMGFLSALLVFAPVPLYPAYIGRSEPWGLSALEDQQLAGLIMWVPASIPYFVGGLGLVAGYLNRLERRHPQNSGPQGNPDGTR